jgi:hypothetical protein
MATKSIRTDDLTGEELTGEVTPTPLTYCGREYSLDLGPESVQKLNEALAPFIAAVDPDNVRPLVPPSVVREWARTQEDMEIYGVGRLPQEVLDAYNAAHGRPA